MKLRNDANSQIRFEISSITEVNEKQIYFIFNKKKY